MTAEPHVPYQRAGTPLEEFLALEPPEGFRAELIDGETVVSAPPDGDHEDHIGLIVEQVIGKARVRTQFAGTKGLLLPGDGGVPDDHVIPDGTFAPRERRLFRGAAPWMRCEGVALVLEVTSSEPQADREAKRRGYARAGVPLYLLVDREISVVTLFGEPEGDDYRRLVRRGFGDALPLPAPFAFDLDTGDFL